MTALVALTKSTVTPKRPIDPATMKIIVMCSAPAKIWTCHISYLCIQSTVISTLSFDIGLQLDGGTPLLLTNTGPADTTAAWLPLVAAWCTVLLVRC